MRMYLRFLAARGECSPTVLGAVPTAPGWRLCVLPRYVPADDIERLIGSCDVTTPVGLRDRAILLLLARLALRAGDVVHLRLSDLDWDNARVRVCGKSRREVGLPLPQDAGDAVLDYIEHARPRIGEDRVFLTVRAPYRPFTSSNAITDIVIQALKRTGMNDVKPKGAYLLRHSAATNLLRAGATLDVIGALLRHRSPDTTVIYAKTDRPMLLEVAATLDRRRAMTLRTHVDRYVALNAISASSSSTTSGCCARGPPGPWPAATTSSSSTR